MTKPSEENAATCECDDCKRIEAAGKTGEVAATPAEPVESITDARSELVMLGPVECRLRRVPVEAVLGLLSPEGLRRVDAYDGASLELMRQRLLATDGCATPVIFEAAEVAAGPPTILHGYEELAAARVSGVPDIPVILVPSGGASPAQSHIVEMVRRQRIKGQKSSDDDELFYRVHAEA